MQKKYNSHTAQLFQQIGSDEIKSFLKWLDQSRNVHETIEIEPWMDYRWHLHIKDHRIEKYPLNAMFGISLDAWQGVILLKEHDPERQGAFCFLRSHRWSRLLKKRYPAWQKRIDFDDYRETSGPHLEKKAS